MHRTLGCFHLGEIPYCGNYSPMRGWSFAPQTLLYHITNSNDLVLDVGKYPTSPTRGVPKIISLVIFLEKPETPWGGGVRVPVP